MDVMIPRPWWAAADAQSLPVPWSGLILCWELVLASEELVFK